MKIDPAIIQIACDLGLDPEELSNAIICYSSQTTLTSGAFKTEDDMDPQEEGDEKSTN